MSKIKEILCMHHSHLDIGYTHPQPMLLALQQDYLNQAIDLCVKTSDYPEESRFRWTLEATYPLLTWLENASDKDIRLVADLIERGQISITASMMHTTPLSDLEEIIRLFEPVKKLREIFGCPITSAINHDVNGQPWPFSQVLLDAGIDFYLTGINIHFGGIPFQRPAAFYWETPDKQKLLSYLGEHYSLFSQYLHTHQEDTGLMEKGINEYIERLEKSNYPYDFLFLTATNPPLYDNNCPDHALASLIRKYNSEDHGHIIRFVTPEMLKEKVLSQNLEIPVHAGDWTDYWNFGSGSSARETSLTRRAKDNLKKTEMIEAVLDTPNSPIYTMSKKEAFMQIALYDEHTWGAAQSINEPDSMETYSQRTHKSKYAYEAADLSGYLLGSQMEKLAGNPVQSSEPEGVMLVNTSPFPQELPLRIPSWYFYKGRHLSALRTKQFLPYSKTGEYKEFGTIKLEPFGWKKIPFSSLQNFESVEGLVSNQAEPDSGKKEKLYDVTDQSIDTPYYHMSFNPETGRITRLRDKGSNWDMLDDSSEWTFFEYVNETIDPRHHKENRETLFPRDIDLGNRSISVWNHDWKAVRRGIDTIVSWHIEENENDVSFVFKSKGFGVRSMEQRITFSVLHPRIGLSVKMDKEDIRVPESIYFAFPLNLEEGYKCHFDTAGLFVELDEEQLGNVCRDYITIDKTVSLYDGKKGVTLACPDAPLVQVGDFNFAKEHRRIKRTKNPLLLAWPINNYWDTNFWISQPGYIELEYEFTAIRDFDPVETYRLGINATSPVVMLAAVDCKKEESGTLIKSTADGVIPHYIKPSENPGCFVITLVNTENKENEFIYSSPNKNISNAFLVSVLDEVIESVPVINNEVKILLPARAIRKLRIELQQ